MSTFTASSDSFEAESMKESVDDSVPVEDVSQTAPVSVGVWEEASAFPEESIGGESDGPILPSLSETVPEEGFALREWRRLNAIRLAEKEKEEKEMLGQIIKEADEFKEEFYRKFQIARDSRKASNREREKQILVSQENFHSEAHNHYWKAIGELIPREVPTMEKRGKKEKEKKPSVVFIQGPKPGKPTDMSRMRQILVKLKHTPPAHMKPETPAEVEKDVKDGPAAPIASTDTKAGTNASTSLSAPVDIP